VPLLAVALLLVLPLVLIALLPLALVQRYRAGSARRLARPWVATLNAAAMTFSVCFFVAAAGITNIWVPNALNAALGGVALGALLGCVGLAITRWESTPRTLHYTPNKWLVLGVTLIVTTRLLYGFWRGWATMRAEADMSWVAAFGVAGSLGAGAIVLGYYFFYGLGLLHRVRKWQRRPLRSI
jgi:hypothetical protein